MNVTIIRMKRSEIPWLHTSVTLIIFFSSYCELNTFDNCKVRLTRVFQIKSPKLFKFRNQKLDLSMYVYIHNAVT